MRSWGVNYNLLTLSQVPWSHLYLIPQDYSSQDLCVGQAANFPQKRIPHTKFTSVFPFNSLYFLKKHLVSLTQS